MTALPSRHFSGCHIATKEEHDQRSTPGKERSQEGDVDSRIQVQLEEDGNCCTELEGAKGMRGLCTTQILFQLMTK